MIERNKVEEESHDEHDAVHHDGYDLWPRFKYNIVGCTDLT